MTPCTDYRYFLPSHGLAFEVFWPRPARTGSDWIRARFRGMFFGGPTPGSPEAAVDPDALSAALELVEAQDIEAATMAFTEMGYDVRVHALR